MNNQAPQCGSGSPQDPLHGSGRVYSGRIPSERALERRGRLVEAGIEVFGTIGYTAAKIKTLCQSAGLSERYFYESFASREHLLTTVYARLCVELLQQTRHAMQVPGLELLGVARAGMAAVVDFMLGDPRHAQIFLVEIVGVTPGLEAKRHRSLTLFASDAQNLLLLLAGISPELAASTRAARAGVPAEVLELARLTAVAIVGGVNNMLLDALHGGTTRNPERLTEASFQLICNASTGIRLLAAKCATPGSGP